MGDFQSITMYEVCLLHSRADRALRVVVGRELDAFNLSLMEWLLLATVGTGPVEGLTMSEVAGRLDVTLPQVTALMNDLIKQKLLKQKVSTSDRRSRRLVSTLQGKRLITKIEEVTSKAVREWLSRIPEEQLDVYMETITAMSNHKSAARDLEQSK